MPLRAMRAKAKPRRCAARVGERWQSARTLPFASPDGKSDPDRNRADTSARSGGRTSPRPVSSDLPARFRSARWLTHQFATGSSPARFIAQASFRGLPSTRPQICRDSQRKSVRPEVGSRQAASPEGPRRCAPRAARTFTAFRFSLIALGRSEESGKQAARRCLSAKTSAIARDAAHGQDVSNSRGDGQLSFLRRGGFAPKLVTPAGKTNLDRHPGAGLRGLLARLPFTHQPAIIPLRSSGGESVR